MASECLMRADGLKGGASKRHRWWIESGEVGGEHGDWTGERAMLLSDCLAALARLPFFQPHLSSKDEQCSASDSVKGGQIIFLDDITGSDAAYDGDVIGRRC